MKRTICDCCGTDSGRFIKLKIPLMQNLHGEPQPLGLPFDEKGQSVCMAPRKVDVCETCANRFLRLYYKINRENNRSGIMVITERY